MAEEDVKTPVNEEAPVTEQVQEQPADTAAPASAAQTADAEAPVAKPRKKKAKRTVTNGQIHVLATFNNTIISVTDAQGNVLASSSAGASGFRGSKKGTAYAAQVAAERAIAEAKQSYGLTKAEVFVKGIGLGREAAIRTLVSQRMQIESIKDVTGVPHGGVRPRRAKRN